jgi:hypothetical protein
VGNEGSAERALGLLSVSEPSLIRIWKRKIEVMPRTSGVCVDFSVDANSIEENIHGTTSTTPKEPNLNTQ